MADPQQPHPDVQWAVHHRLIVERSHPTRSLCTAVAMNNLTQMPSLFNRFSVALLGFMESSDILDHDQRVNDFHQDVTTDTDPSIDRAFHALRVTGHIIPYPQGENYKVIYRTSTAAAFAALNPTHFILRMGISIGDETERHSHNEAIRYVPSIGNGGTYYLLTGRHNCRVAKLGNLASVGRIFFTEGGRHALRAWLQHEYSSRGSRVRVFLGEHWAEGLEDTADLTPLLLVPRMNLPMGNSTPWDVLDNMSEVNAALDEDVAHRNDATVLEGVRTCIQALDLGVPAQVERYVSDLSRNRD